MEVSGDNCRMDSIIMRALVIIVFILYLNAYFLIYVGWFFLKCAGYLTKPFWIAVCSYQQLKAHLQSTPASAWRL